MPAHKDFATPLEQQLLLQLGARLRLARKSCALTSAALAQKAGISRTTLSAVEHGEPSPTIGTYIRVMSALGLVAELALLATSPPAAREDVARNFGPGSLHLAQDLQSLLMHREAVRMLRNDPSLAGQLQQTLSRWLKRDDPNSRPLLQRWGEIISHRDWAAATADNEEARQLRQASPMATLLPHERRLAIIRKVNAMKERGRATS